MVEIIKKVTFIFIGTGINNKYQACVYIYDSCNRLVYKGKTKNGKLVLYLKKHEVYKLKAISLGEMIYTNFITTRSKYVFVFNRSIYIPSRTITFLLTDANYNNLPIEKGEIILWQRQ